MAVIETGAPGRTGRIAVRWVLLGVMLVLLLGMLDSMVVNTAMPTIVRQLGGRSLLSWVVTAYTLASAVTTPVWGKLGDLFGRKPVFLTAIVVFLLGSALAGAAPSMGLLITFRTLQGLGAGGLAVSAFALIADLVTPRERGRYQGMTVSVMAVGLIGGPLVGGLVTTGLGWRWAFYLNLPLGLLALTWCAIVLRAPVRTRRAVIDWAGIVLLAATISAVVLIGTWAGTTYAVTSPPILGLAAVAVLALAGFVLRERRAVEPLLPPRLFARRNYRLAMLMIFSAGIATFSGSLYLPLFQQFVQGASAAASGLRLLPLLVPVLVVSQIAGKTMSRTGRYKIFPVLGGVLMTAGLALLATMTTTTSPVLTGGYLVILGAGQGFLMQMTNTIAQNSVERRDIGAASAGVTLFQTAGGTLGLSALGALFTRATAHGTTPALVAAGTHQVFLAAAGAAAVAGLAAVLVHEIPLRGSAPVTPERTV
jgi:EmrB/QacA subfamily drug resistance transporter